MVKNTIYIFFVLFILFSCKKENEPSSQKVIADDYTGLKIGNVLFYDVKYVFHDDQVDRHDTTYFKIKSVIEDTFRDNENNLRYKIHRFRWNDTIASWVNYKVFSVFIKDQFYFESEDNYLVKKLFLPYMYGLEWNSNMYNTNDSLNFRYKNLYSEFKINTLSFDKLIHVKQQFFKSYVDLKRKSEFYAKDKGLVLKIYKDLKIKKGDTLNVDKGEEWYWTVYDYVKK
jgi:hypothetical protein